MTSSYNQNNIHLIYAGGTFGGHGNPIAPLAAEVFLPVLSNLLSQKIDTPFTILSNERVKDSSALTPNDLVYFYRLITQAYHDGARKFVLITGTDSLSFLAAFLAHALTFDDICLVITGSMYPLLVTDNPDFELNKHSDAWHNLSEAIDVATCQTGVMVQFYHQTLWAYNTQKIDSHQINAFIGESINEYQQPLLPAHTTNDDALLQLAPHTHIQSIYLLPNHPNDLIWQLKHLHPHTKAVILIAFGAGNLSKTHELIDEFERLHQRNIAIVCTTMCAHGGVSPTYQAGAWQYQHHVWSGGKLSIAGIYSRLLWLSLTNHLTKEHWNAYHE